MLKRTFSSVERFDSASAKNENFTDEEKKLIE